jgi:hypothetical protein
MVAGFCVPSQRARIGASTVQETVLREKMYEDLSV